MMLGHWKAQPHVRLGNEARSLPRRAVLSAARHSKRHGREGMSGHLTAVCCVAVVGACGIGGFFYPYAK